MSKGSDTKQKRQQPFIRLLNNIIAISSFIFLGAILLYLVIEAFQTSLTMGIRSLCAAALPIVAVIYLTYFVHRFHLARNNYLPRISVYVLSTLWSLILFYLLVDLYDPDQLFSIPIIELLFTITLTVFILIYKGLQYATALAASYGLITGMMIFIIFLPSLRS